MNALTEFKLPAVPNVKEATSSRLQSLIRRAN